MSGSDSALTRTVCGMKLEEGKRCQNPVKPGKGPCWRHANGFWRKVRSFAQNETKTFILTTALGLAGVVATVYYGALPSSRPWVAIKDPTLANTVELSDRGFDASVRLPLENTSDTPAVAAVGASLFFLTDHQPKPGIERAQDNLCKRIQDQMETEKIVTSTVFRGTERYPMTTSVHADRKEVDEAIRLMTLKFLRPGSEPEFAPLIISCAVYRATTGKNYYNSAYANVVSRVICNTDNVCSAGFMLAKNRKYNPNELVFPPSFDSGIRAK